MKGIYKIYCIPESKYYIGSSININRRWSEHKRQLNRQAHKNNYLQLDWDAYGDESFEFSILELTEDLVAREQQWINTYTNNYNIAKDCYNPMRNKELVDKMMKTKWDNNEKITFTQKLNQDSVLEIIARVNKGDSDIVIARDYNVLRGAIWSIKTGNTWKHLHHLVKPRKNYNESRSEARILGIALYKEGKTIKEICEATNRQSYTVKRWISSIKSSI